MSDRRLPPNDLLACLDHWAGEQPDQPWLIEHWSSHQLEITWREAQTAVRGAAAWLADYIAQHGGTSGARIGLLSRNRAHWVLADLAIMASGHVTVPIFTTMNREIVEYIADFTGIDVLLLGPADNWEGVRHGLPEGIPIVRLPEAPAVNGALEWDEVVAAGLSLPAPPHPNPNALATVIFTSGTTGRPKGVMHSAHSLFQASSGIARECETRPGSRFFSYLPLAHGGERIVVELQALVAGGSISFNQDLNTFLGDLRHTQPTYLLGVPRIWEKLQQAVLAQVASAEAIDQAERNGELAGVQAKVRAYLGLDQIEYILTSTAPTPDSLKAWYERMGIELYDGYGQSEILPLTVSRKGQRKAGTVGTAAAGVELRISADGEILARAPGTAMGYYGQPDITARAFETDGWVHTGDKGYLDADGHLHLTGRVKEIFKTSKGKYVAPAPIEGRFLDTPLVEQACLTGAGLARTVMIAVLSVAATTQEREKLQAALMQHIAELNKTLEKHELIGALLVASEPWTQENDILTHTLKIKRDAVEKRFASDIATAGDRMRNGEPLFVVETTLN